MPELPEVETVMTGLKPALEGLVLRQVRVRRADLRAPFPAQFAAKLQGRRVLRLHRRAKYILADLDDGQTLIIHLGMSGRMGVFPGPHAPEPHDHVILTTEAATVAFNDPRRFGLMTLAPTGALASHPLFADLGPEPLTEDFNARTLAAALAGRRTPIKAALLDQRTVAGLGNIYVCESLFRAHIAPTRPAAEVTETAALVRAVKSVLKAAITSGGTTLRDARYVQTGGELGYFAQKLNVYDREGAPCRTKGCKGTILRIVQSGRSSYYCPHCQT